MEFEERRKIVAELEKYASLEGTELGEFLEALCAMANRDYCMTDEFREMYDLELVYQLNNMKENTTIVKRTVTPEPVEYEELEWNDGY